MAQWIRVHLSTQGTQVQFPVWEEPTCCGTTSPGAASTDPVLRSRDAESMGPALRSLGAASTEPTLEGSILCNKRSPQNQKPVRHDYRVAPTHPKERKP